MYALKIHLSSFTFRPQGDGKVIVAYVKFQAVFILALFIRQLLRTIFLARVLLWLLFLHHLFIYVCFGVEYFCYYVFVLLKCQSWADFLSANTLPCGLKSQK